MAEGMKRKGLTLEDLEFPATGGGGTERGISPLHVLAEKPTAFRSGIHLAWFNKIIYHGISVEELIPAGTSRAKNFFQELRKLIKLPGKSKKHLDPENPEEGQGIERLGHNSRNIGAQGHKPLPSKYGRCLRFIKLVSQVLLVIISVMPAWETPILLASRNGIVEMVEKILQLFSMAIYDTDGQNMNIVLKAVENRQSHIYDFLLNSNLPHREIAFHAVDEQGNSALHLAGKLAGYRHFQHIPTSMLHMQWEVKWYQYVQNSLLPDFVVKNNRTGNSPDKIFQAEHRELEDESKHWLNSTSNSCSFIAALIATVAFASTASVPGGLQWLNSTSNSCSFIAALIATVAFASSAGVKQDTGSIFAIAPLVALFCSVISLLIFCAIFISKDEDKDFTTNLPRKFLFGLTSLFISIAAMLTCFCSGNFLMLKGQLKYAGILLYALTGVVMAYFVLKHFPLFIGLLKATFRKVPERIYKEYLWIAFVL